MWSMARILLTRIFRFYIIIPSIVDPHRTLNLLSVLRQRLTFENLEEFIVSRREKDNFGLCPTDVRILKCVVIL